jgi:hypothetical protein
MICRRIGNDQISERIRMHGMSVRKNDQIVLQNLNPLEGNIGEHLSADVCEPVKDDSRKSKILSPCGRQSILLQRIILPKNEGS